MAKQIAGPAPVFVIEKDDTYTTFQQQQEAYVKALINKWKWLLEAGDKPVPQKLWRQMAVLFENQEACSRGLLAEQTTTADIVVPTVMAMPLIRAIYPRMWATRVASLQPLPLAGGGAGKIFFLKFWREDVDPDTRLNVLDSDYAFSAENAVPKRVKLTVDSIDVTATKDILAAVWSQEVEEDARGALGLNVRQALVQSMSGEIAREQDERVLNEILNGAATQVVWHRTIGSGYLAKEWYETLGHAIVTADMNIWAAHYRRADWVVCGSEFYSILQKTSGFKFRERGDDEGEAGIELVGRFEGMYDIYLSAMVGSAYAVVGRYARSVIETGYVIAPYIPLSPMPAVYAEMDTNGVLYNKDKWTQNVRTRWAKRMVQNTFFSRIVIQD